MRILEALEPYIDRISELEKQLEAAGKRIDLLSSTNITLSNQIKKMKNCFNCKYFEWCEEVNYFKCKKPNKNIDLCLGKNKWELAE